MYVTFTYLCKKNGKLTLLDPDVAENATTPAQSSVRPNFLEPTSVMAEVRGSGLAVSTSMFTVNTSNTAHTNLCDKISKQY